MAVGLSYGFIEPLEATGIATTLENVFRLLECVSKRDLFVTQIDKDLFNHSVADQIDGFKKFVDRHYYLSSKDDSDYWKYVTENIDYKISKEFLDQMVVNRNLDVKSHGTWVGDLYVCGGMDYSCYSKAYTLFSNPDREVLVKQGEDFEKLIEEMKQYVRTQSSSYKYLKDTIYDK